VPGRWGLPSPHPSFPRRSASLADGTLPRATNAWQVEAAASTPLFPLRSTFVLKTARYRGQRGALQVWAAAPTLPLSAALGFCLADASLPRETKRLAGGGCRPYTPDFCCARLVLQKACCRGQRIAWQMGTAAPHPCFRCARLLCCRRLATAGTETFCRCGLPLLHSRFPRRSAFVFQTPRYRGQ
jgi:hypothetical protein